MKRSVLLIVVTALAGCASRPSPPPRISLDEPVAVKPAMKPAVEPPKPLQMVEVPVPLALPCQLKPLWASPSAMSVPESADPSERVTRANAAARVAPTREGYVNAVQVWPYSEGALYQVYASPGHVTVIALQEGEELIAVSAGDTSRWIVGDTASGDGATRRSSILVKPTRVDLKTNLVITTSRRTYLVELTSTEQAWMASASWDYPRDRLISLQKPVQKVEAATPVAAGLQLEDLRFRYAIRGDSPAWKPLRAFDDGERVYIQFPGRIAQGELPPLFVIGEKGDAQLVNYRFRAPYYVVDRLFGAAELRLGGADASVVRIERVDGAPRRVGS